MKIKWIDKSSRMSDWLQEKKIECLFFTLTYIEGKMRQTKNPQINSELENQKVQKRVSPGRKKVGKGIRWPRNPKRVININNQHLGRSAGGGGNFWLGSFPSSTIQAILSPQLRWTSKWQCISQTPVPATLIPLIKLDA